MLALWLLCLLFGIGFVFFCLCFVWCIVIAWFSLLGFAGLLVGVGGWVLLGFGDDCCLFCSCLVWVFVVQFGDLS